MPGWRAQATGDDGRVAEGPHVEVDDGVAKFVFVSFIWLLCVFGQSN